MNKFMINFLTIAFVLLANCFAQVPSSGIPSYTLWSFTESNIPGCPGSLGIPRFSLITRTPGIVHSIETCVFDFENLEPLAPFICSAVPNSTPSNLGYCVQTLHECLFFGFADINGKARITMRVPVDVPLSLMPQGINTYLGFMQLISFTSTINYCASNPILITGINI